MRWLLVSATTIAPLEGIRATPRGLLNIAVSPLPAKVETIPEGDIFRIRLLYQSATTISPFAITVTGRACAGAGGRELARAALIAALGGGGAAIRDGGAGIASGAPRAHGHGCEVCSSGGGEACRARRAGGGARGRVGACRARHGRCGTARAAAAGRAGHAARGRAAGRAVGACGRCAGDASGNRSGGNSGRVCANNAGCTATIRDGAPIACGALGALGRGRCADLRGGAC